MDEAVFMWGSYVQGEIEKVTRKAKSDRQAEQAVQRILRKLLDEDEAQYRDNVTKDAEGVEHEMPPPRPNGRFRDPASVIRTGE